MEVLQILVGMVVAFLPLVRFTMVTGHGLGNCRVGDCHRRRRCIGYHGG